jgi:hypothetical protein
VNAEETLEGKDHFGPNIAADWLASLLRTREIPGSNLGRRPVILTEVFRSFS